MDIRTYRAGDEAVQVAVYNEATADLPKFKPATEEEVKRRCRGRDFDPTTRFYAEVNGRVVGYASFHAHGRISYPWCLNGQEHAAEPLLGHVLQAMKSRGLKTAFAAYRTDWTAQKEFFLAQGFQQVREMVNYVLDPADMPTRPDRRTNPLSPLRREDVPAIFHMAPQALRVSSPEQLEQHLFHNPYFGSEAFFVLRNRTDDTPVAVGLLIADPNYANPLQLDAAMPCFRLGAFGTEGMHTKRINGLFSFLTSDQRNVSPLALDLVGHANTLFEENESGTLAAQAPSDAGHLIRFYNSFFRRQGSFPVFERTL